MKRTLSAVALAAAVVGTAWAASAASAASPSRTSITLACDREVSATAMIALRSSGGGLVDTLPVSCGPGFAAAHRDRLVVTQPAEAAEVTVFSLTPATSEALDCGSRTGTPVPLPLRQDCVGPDGAGARLVVR